MMLKMGNTANFLYMITGNNLQQIKQEIESIKFTGSIKIRLNEFIKKPISTAKKLIELLESNPGNEGYKPYSNTLMLILKEIKNETK